MVSRSESALIHEWWSCRAECEFSITWTWHPFYIDLCITAAILEHCKILEAHHEPVSVSTIALVDYMSPIRKESERTQWSFVVIKMMPFTVEWSLELNVALNFAINKSMKRVANCAWYISSWAVAQLYLIIFVEKQVVSIDRLWGWKSSHFSKCNPVI